MADALRLPTFSTSGIHLYKPLTMVVRSGVIEYVFYPAFPPDSPQARSARS